MGVSSSEHGIECQSMGVARHVATLNPLVFPLAIKGEGCPIPLGHQRGELGKANQVDELGARLLFRT